MGNLRSSTKAEVLGHQGFIIHKKLAGTPVVTTRREERLITQEGKREGRKSELSPAPEVVAAGSTSLDTHSVQSCLLEAIHISFFRCSEFGG